MNRNLITDDERSKAIQQLETALAKVTEHPSNEPFCDFELGTYEGDTEPILVAIVRGFRWGAKSLLDVMTPQEKLDIIDRL